MKRALRISSLFVTLFALNVQIYASKVSQATAQTVAISFFKLNAKNTVGRNNPTATLKYTKTESDGTVDFYVFDMSPAKGFVVISADDQLTPVIAYSFESNFNLAAQKQGVQTWMNHAGAHIHSAIQRHSMANSKISGQWAAYLQGVKPGSAKSTGVAPLLTTNWNQEPYYNQLCPYNSADQTHALTGCVATAMAQIMKYWNYPARGTGSYGYSNAPPAYSFNYGNQLANFDSTTYNWANMPDSLTGNNLSVAILMYQCGVAVATNYGDDNQGGSGAFVLNSETASWKPTAQKAYSTYFSYNANTITGVQEANYSAIDWINLLESELNAGRPVQYEGIDTNEGGHTWVCDGYDENDFLHMNWGWGGLDNGFYSVSALSADGYNFSNSEAALIGIQPVSGLTVAANVSNANICKGSSTTLSAQGSTQVSYSWAPVNGLSCATCATTMASPDSTTTYAVTIDSAGFSATSQVTVVVHNINVSSTQVNNVTCYGRDDGAAKVFISGGNAGYTFLWNNGANKASALNLVAGNYEVTISDAFGCSTTTGIAIVQPDSLLASINASNIACSLDNGHLSVAVSGGTPFYTYTWTGGQHDSVISSLSTGLYSVTATDAKGCTAASSFNVAQPAPMVVTIMPSNTSCSLVYATATANVTGGHENFSFAWNNGDNTRTITNLSARNYFVTVTDSLGCTSSDSLFLSQPDSMNISIATSNTAVNKVYGNAVANVTGGEPQYSFLWNTGDTTETILYAATGNYAVTITDSKGCAQTAATQITEATALRDVAGNVAFDVYPNPATTNLTVQLGTTSNDGSIVKIKNILGQTLISGKIIGLESQIDLSELSGGIYFVAITQGQNTGVKQVAVKR